MKRLGIVLYRSESNKKVEEMWFAVIIVIVLLGLIAVPILFMYAFSHAFKPNTPQQQLKEFGANLIGFEFVDEGYEVLESKSQNNHPDRPQDLTIKLSDYEFDRLKAHIDTLSEGEERKEKDGKAYVRTITKRDDGCFFRHTSIHINCNYPFFTASTKVDYAGKTVSFGSSFI